EADVVEGVDERELVAAVDVIDRRQGDERDVRRRRTASGADVRRRGERRPRPQRPLAQAESEYAGRLLGRSRVRVEAKGKSQRIAGAGDDDVGLIGEEAGDVFAA